MTLQRWRYDLHEYVPFEVPDGTRVALYCDDMDTLVSCASCFSDVVYGDTYTSMEIHNAAGLGYAVCSSCYTRECARRRAEKGTVK